MLSISMAQFQHRSEREKHLAQTQSRSSGQEQELEWKVWLKTRTQRRPKGQNGPDYFLSFNFKIKRIWCLLKATIGTTTCSAFMTSKYVWDKKPTLMLSPFLVKTIASLPKRIEPDLKPFPYNPTGTWSFMVTFSLKPKLKRKKYNLHLSSNIVNIK